MSAVQLAESNNVEFKASRELKNLYSRSLDEWRRRTRQTQETLAQRCGVTPAYLSQIARYGRIPSRPVLILLALQFELSNPAELFAAAGLTEEWPLERGLQLLQPHETERGFLSVKLDMPGFTDAIKQIVRAEIRPRTVRELTNGLPLKLGYNTNQRWFFARTGEASEATGVFPGLISLLKLAVQNEAHARDVHYRDAFDRLKHGELDLYGPIFSTPERFGLAVYTEPFCSVGISAMWRKVYAPALRPISPPRSLDELKDLEYKIAVLRDSMSHHFARTDLGRTDDDLVICETREEVLERLMLSTIQRPAHISIADSMTAIHLAREHSKHLEPLFTTGETVLGWLGNVIAVRPDWPELAGILSETIRYGLRGGAIVKMIDGALTPELRGIVRPGKPD